MKTFDINKLVIRDETEKDYLESEAMIRRAFWDLYKPKCDEHYLTHVLRDSSVYLPLLTRLAVYEGKIVGAIYYATSQVIDGDKTYKVITFGPLAVEPAFQRLGIGGKLLEATLAKAKELGYEVVVILGEPHYYPKYGFKRGSEFGIVMPDGNTLDALMCYELRPGALKNIHGQFDVGDVFMNIDQTAVEQYDKIFQK